MDNYIEFTNEVTRKDYKKAAYFSVYLKNKAFIIIVPLSIILSFVVMFMSIFNIYPINKYFIYSCITYMAIFIVFIISMEFSVNGYMKTDKLIIGKKYKFVINQDEISAEEKKLNSKNVYKWDNIYKCYRTNKMFLIFLTASQILIIPKRYLNDSQQELLSNIMREKMANNFIIRFDKIKIF